MLGPTLTNRTKLLALAAVVALALAGCGAASSSSTPSAQDPADVVPSNALLYVSLPARLQSPAGPAFSAVLNRLFGGAAQAKVNHLLDKLAASAHTTFATGIKPWLGSHVGVAVTQFPSLLGLAAAGIGGGGSEQATIGRAVLADVAVIVPTDNPGAASNFLKLADKGGIPDGLTATVHGNYVLLGGQAAVSAVEHTTASKSLADSPGYSAMLARLGTQPVGSLYASARLAKTYLALVGAASKLPASIFATSEAQLNKLPASASELVALTATDTTLQLNLLQNGFPEKSQRVPANVGTLTGASWLALSTGSFNLPAAIQAAFKFGVSQGISQQAANESSKVQHAAAVVDDALGGLGPISLSMSGTSVGHANLGFSMTPSDATAAEHLLSVIYDLAHKDPNNGLQGSPTAFTLLTKHHQVLHVSEVAGRIQALIGYPSASAFLNSAVTLADNASYRAALAQLQADASVPLYVRFGPLVSLTAAQQGKAKAVLRKLSYLIVGHTPGDTRIVLGLN